MRWRLVSDFLCRENIAFWWWCKNNILLTQCTGSLNIVFMPLENKIHTCFFIILTKCVFAQSSMKKQFLTSEDMENTCTLSAVVEHVVSHELSSYRVMNFAVKPLCMYLFNKAQSYTLLSWSFCSKHICYYFPAQIHFLIGGERVMGQTN